MYQNAQIVDFEADIALTKGCILIWQLKRPKWGSSLENSSGTYISPPNGEFPPRAGDYHEGGQGGVCFPIPIPKKLMVSQFPAPKSWFPRFFFEIPEFPIPSSFAIPNYHYLFWEFPDLKAQFPVPRKPLVPPRYRTTTPDKRVTITQGYFGGEGGL